MILAIHSLSRVTLNLFIAPLTSWHKYECIVAEDGGITGLELVFAEPLQPEYLVEHLQHLVAVGEVIVGKLTSRLYCQLGCVGTSNRQGYVEINISCKDSI